MKIPIRPITTIIHPHPVFVIGTYDKKNNPNLATVSWGGICCSEPPCIAISLRKETLTYHNIKENNAFTVNIPSEKHAKLADFFGLVSGKEVDKFKKAKLTPIKSERVNAPYIEEFPYSLHCTVLHTIEIGLHTQFIGHIVDIVADKEILNPQKLPDIKKVKPIIYGSKADPFYFTIGEPVAEAFHSGFEIVD